MAVGQRTLVGPEVESLTCCVVCQRPFIGVSAAQRTCASPDCVRVWEVMANRAKNARHHERTRTTTGSRQPWLLGQPACGLHLPGGGCELFVDPLPKWPMEHRNVRGLHGALTALVDNGHPGRFAGFSLVPWPRGSLGWGVYWRTPEGCKLAGGTWEGTLWDRPTRFRFGPLVRMRTPDIRKRGRRRLAIEAITPVVIKSNNSHTGRVDYRTTPTADSLRSAISVEFPMRVGVQIERDSVCLELVEHDTQIVRTQLGSKYGTVPGWVGRVVVETNAVGHWLLEAAARGPGLGSRVGFGFGRVRVTDAPR